MTGKSLTHAAGTAAFNESADTLPLHSGVPNVVIHTYHSLIDAINKEGEQQRVINQWALGKRSSIILMYEEIKGRLLSRELQRAHDDDHTISRGIYHVPYPWVRKAFRQHPSTQQGSHSTGRCGAQYDMQLLGT